jgi:hypothetical protein
VLSCAVQAGLVRHSPPLGSTLLSSTHIVVYSSLHIHKVEELYTKVEVELQAAGLIQLPGVGSVNVLFYPSTLSLHRGALQFPVPVSL